MTAGNGSPFDLAIAPAASTVRIGPVRNELDSITELAICGYPPRDLLLQTEFINKSQKIASQLDVDLPVLVGTPIAAENDRQLPFNGVVLAGSDGGKTRGEGSSRVVAKKQLLPTYDVFDEARYFKADTRSGIARTIGGMDFGVTVCEDAWQAAGQTPSAYAADPIEHLAEWGRQGVELSATVNLSASPFHSDKVSTRVHVSRTAAKILGHPFLLANQVGANDDLLFDGCSLIAWPDGQVVIAPAWQEGVLIVDLDSPQNCHWIASDSEDSINIGSDQIKHLSSDDDGHDDAKHLVEELADAANELMGNGMNGFVIGVSGGIDSAVSSMLCAKTGFPVICVEMQCRAVIPASILLMMHDIQRRH